MPEGFFIEVSLSPKRAADVRPVGERPAATGPQMFVRCVGRDASMSFSSKHRWVGSPGRPAVQRCQLSDSVAIFSKY